MVQVQEDVKRLLTESKVLAMKSRMERLILAIGDGRNKDRETTPDPAPTGERKRTLGVLPSFITGTTDFTFHLEAFRDYCVLNEFNVAEKVKRLFLMTLDQTAGGAGSKLCFLCGMRMKNLSQAMSRNGCMAWCPQILNKRGCKVTIVALVWNDIQHFLFYVDQDKHVCDSSQLILFPHILREFLLLLRLGFARWAVSPDVDLCGVFKQCQKKPEAYYKGLPSTITISLYLKSRGGNQATPIEI